MLPPPLIALARGRIHTSTEVPTDLLHPSMSATTYETFEIRIQPGTNGLYEALVTRSLAGDARVDFALPFGDDELASFLWQTAGATRDFARLTMPVRQWTSGTSASSSIRRCSAAR